MSELIYNKVTTLEELADFEDKSNQVVKVGDASDPSFAVKFLALDPVGAVVVEASLFACLTTAPGDLDPQFVESHGFYLLRGNGHE